MRGQLLGASQGLLSVVADDSLWVVPATHAVWIPPNVGHGLRSHGPFAGWNVYVATPDCESLPANACVLCVSALLREAVTRAAVWDDAAQARLAGVILDEIRASPEAALGLPMPQDVRLLFGVTPGQYDASMGRSQLVAVRKNTGREIVPVLS